MSARLHPHKTNAKVVTTKMQFSEGCQKHWYFTVFQIYCQLLCTKIYSTLGFLKKKKRKEKAACEDMLYAMARSTELDSEIVRFDSFKQDDLFKSFLLYCILFTSSQFC